MGTQLLHLRNKQKPTSFSEEAHTSTLIRVGYLISVKSSETQITPWTQLLFTLSSDNTHTSHLEQGTQLLRAEAALLRPTRVPIVHDALRQVLLHELPLVHLCRSVKRAWAV